jgi:hypothetical protein
VTAPFLSNGLDCGSRTSLKLELSHPSPPKGLHLVKDAPITQANMSSTSGPELVAPLSRSPTLQICGDGARQKRAASCSGAPEPPQGRRSPRRPAPPGAPEQPPAGGTGRRWLSIGCDRSRAQGAPARRSPHCIPELRVTLRSGAQGADATLRRSRGNLSCQKVRRGLSPKPRTTNASKPNRGGVELTIGKIRTGKNQDRVAPFGR